MDALSIPRTCSQAALLQISVSQSSRRRDQSEIQTQHRISVQVSQGVRVTSVLVMPPFSAINGHKRLVGLLSLHIERTSARRSSLLRLDKELVRRMVRAEKEPAQPDDKEKPGKTNDSGHQLWLSRARNLQTNLQIFCSTMFWIVLFFMASIWDAEKWGRK